MELDILKYCVFYFFCINDYVDKWMWVSYEIVVSYDCHIYSYNYHPQGEMLLITIVIMQNFTPHLVLSFSLIH